MIMACSNKLRLYAIELLTALGPYCQLFFFKEQVLILCGVHGTDVQEAQFKAEVRKCALYWLH